jgi:hypothetical protein
MSETSIIEAVSSHPSRGRTAPRYGGAGKSDDLGRAADCSLAELVPVLLREFGVGPFEHDIHELLSALAVEALHVE